MSKRGGSNERVVFPIVEIYMSVKISALLLGLATYIPRFSAFRYKFRGGGSTQSAMYCYAVWLRHLVKANQNGLSGVPSKIAELGPGDSLGIGLAALLCGAERYYAFDVVDYSDVHKNLTVFDELLELFQRRLAIPDGSRCPEIKPQLEDYRFPVQILTKDIMTAALDPARVEKIRNSIRDHNSADSMISYRVPWFDPLILSQSSVDMIYSQAVLEHVDNLEHTYMAMAAWLKPGGMMSHQIDFKCHGTAHDWNGHWTYGEKLWRFIKGRRPYLLNREVCSRHLQLIEDSGLNVVNKIRFRQQSLLTKQDLTPYYKDISDEDLSTSGVFVQAMKAGSITSH